MKGKFDAKKLLIRLGVLLAAVALAAVMMVIGRGHTVYLDNKTIEYNGQEYKAFHRVEVSAKGMDKPARLEARERGMAKCIGQSIRLELTVTAKKGDEPQQLSLTVPLPYGMDTPILNLPALLAELPEEAWLDEFIPTPSAADEDVDDVNIGDEFAIDGSEGSDIMG